MEIPAYRVKIHGNFFLFNTLLCIIFHTICSPFWSLPWSSTFWKSSRIWDRWFLFLWQFVVDPRCVTFMFMICTITGYLKFGYVTFITYSYSSILLTVVCLCSIFGIGRFRFLFSFNWFNDNTRWLRHCIGCISIFNWHIYIIFYISSHRCKNWVCLHLF